MNPSDQRLACISIDLDEAWCYASIYGLPRPSGNAASPIYSHAIPRYERLLADLGIQATFFAVGRDLDLSANAAAIKRLSNAGHEIANHSLGHRYELSRLSHAQIAHEVEGCSARIETATGVRPSGFRAPGYTLSETLVDVLTASDLAYDSSVFPCPAYYGAKTAAISLIGLRAQFGNGQPSHSIVDQPAILTAPADPYRMGRPYWKRGDGLLELPIGVTRRLRLPFIGTSVVLGHPVAADLLARAMIGRPMVNLELHGIDLSDKDLDPFGALGDRLPELKRTASEKERSLRAAVRRLQAAGYTFVRMDEIAGRF